MDPEAQIRHLQQLLQQSEKEKEQALQRVGEQEELTRKTTLNEYLHLCHKHLSTTMSIPTDRSKSTKGRPDHPNRKYRPDYLKPWKDYFSKHKETLDSLYNVYPSPQPQSFDNRNFIELTGRDVASHKVGSEPDLLVFIRQTMEGPMTRIMQHLQSLDAVRREFKLPKEFIYENHGNSLSDTAPEDAQKLDAGRPPPSTPPQAHRLPNSNDASAYKPLADQFCFYTTVEGSNKVALVAEFKPPHKLSIEDPRFVFDPKRPEMELSQIVDRSTIPPKGTDEYDAQQAETTVAGVVTQAFSYMVRSETQYGYITTGEAFVFLHIKKEDGMRTIYNYLAEPKKVDLNTGDSLYHITLSQLITFSIHALKSAAENTKWREDVLLTLDRWGRDDQAILEKCIQTPSTTGKSSVDYVPGAESPTGRERGSANTDRKLRRCRPGLDPTPRDDQDPPSDDESSHPRAPTRSAAGTSTQTRRYRSPPPVDNSYHQPNRYAYCTQLCLQGLAMGGPLDHHCPNVSAHCDEGHQGDRHQLSCEEFRALLDKQLRRSRGADFQALGIQGARGALFKVTLTSYEYTVMAKGTVRAYVKYLRHEAEVYGRLAAIQGVYVPIFLGSLDLDYPFYYDTGVLIVHMMLLSWSGECLLKKTCNDKDKEKWTSDLIRAVKAIHEAGVVHRDMRMANLLWSEELKRVMVIDFERAEIAKATGRALSSSLPDRKRKRLCEIKVNDHGDGIMDARTLKYRAKLDLLGAEDTFFGNADRWLRPTW